MASSGYISGRKRWYRPQAMLWSDGPGYLEDGLYVPVGYEETSNLSSAMSSERFIVLSDHNRSEISISPKRIEESRRMINGTMRSYYVADKLNISTSWTAIPSRAFGTRPDFNQANGIPNIPDLSYSNSATATHQPIRYTVDGGAGGAEMLKWHMDHKGSFWVFLAYDNYPNFGTNASAYFNLNKYNEIVQMKITNFDYSVVKRSGANSKFDGYDLWDVSVTLEEV